MQELYLQHHGILGQKWGKRNGPPYPLNSNDKSYAERHPGNNIRAKDVKKNMDYLSDRELQQAINRINMQNQITNLSKEQSIIDKGYNAVMKDMKKFVSFSGTAIAVVTMAKKISSYF